MTVDDDPTAHLLAELEKDLKELEAHLRSTISGLRVTGFDGTMQMRLTDLGRWRVGFEKGRPDCGLLREDYSAHLDAYRRAVQGVLDEIDRYRDDLQKHMQPMGAKELSDLEAGLRDIGLRFKYARIPLGEAETWQTKNIQEVLGRAHGLLRDLQAALEGQRSKAAAFGGNLEDYSSAFRSLKQPTHVWETQTYDIPRPSGRDSDEFRMQTKTRRVCGKCGAPAEEVAL